MLHLFPRVIRQMQSRVLSARVIIMLVFMLGIAQAGHEQGGSCTVSFPSDATIAWDCRYLRSGESLEKISPDRWMDIARFNRMDRRHARAGTFIKMPRRLADMAAFRPMPTRYPAAEGDEQLILIDLSEQFLGAYERGLLLFDMPITSGKPTFETPTGEFRLTAAHRLHQSCLYTIEGTARPYPMTFALRFYVDRNGISYWIHGRDLPGYPASHGCIGLYDESMQHREYGLPHNPILSDAQRLFTWALGTTLEGDGIVTLPRGPKVYVVGRAPVWDAK
jgi:hypothetical protein